jgi:hypothetical protein
MNIMRKGRDSRPDRAAREDRSCAVIISSELVPLVRSPTKFERRLNERY